MNFELVLSIVGGFLVMALSINAFFLRGIFSELAQVKIKLAEIHSDSVHIKQELTRLEIEIDKLRDKTHEHSNIIAKILGQIS